ncbi:MAG: ribonuclease HIII [Opitutales bacterium]|nr:ribonuclease HIII [Opitutales bacterium]
MTKKTKLSDGVPAPKKLALYTLALNALQIAKLGEICAENSAFEQTQTAYTHFSYKSKAHAVTVAAYTSGKVVISGKGTEEFVANILEPQVTGVARLGYDEVHNPEWFETHAGLDESGKGDLFGPVVSACVIAGKSAVEKWLAAGVKDSKQVASDKKIFELEKIIRDTPGVIVKTAFARIEKYNTLYQKFGNLNAFLGHLHFLALKEALAEAEETGSEIPAWGLLDQFSKSPIVQRNLTRNGIDFDLKMRTKAEIDPVVAAASVVARAAYVREIEKISELAGTRLPKGSGAEAKKAATEIFRKFGAARFGEFVKLHFKTASEAALP